MTTTDGHAIMCSKPEKKVKPKSATSWARVPTTKLPEARWGMAATTNSYKTRVLAPRVSILQRPLSDLLQTMLPIQTTVNSKPWQTTSPSRDFFFFEVFTSHH